MNDEPEDSSALFGYYQRRIRLGERLGIVLRLYAVLGLLVAALGGGYVLYSKLQISLKQEEKIGLAMAFVGILTSVLSWGYLSYQRDAHERDLKQFAEHQSVGRFLEAWTRFEEAIRIAAFGKAGAELKYSLRDTLARLRSEGRLSTGDTVSAESLLQIRNSLVHGARRYEVQELDEALSRLIQLLSKM